MDKSRFKNYGLWVAIIALIGLLLGNYGLYDKLGLTVDSYKQITDSILVVLISAGIISNPTTENRGFFDCKK